MNKLTLICLIFVGSALCELTATEQFSHFMVAHNKKYGERERVARAGIFASNLERIAQLNAENPTAKFGINKFSDLTFSEFESKYLMKSYQKIATEGEVVVAPVKDVPASFDWRDHGAVTDVKDQQQCGSCWAFSAAANMESVWFLSGNPLVSFSPQQLVDCDSTDSGCNGGLPSKADAYVIKAGGIMLWEDYPYNGTGQTCKFVKSKAVGKFSSSKALPKTDKAMQEWMLTGGPASIAVHADDTWQHYKSGILPKPTRCILFNHAVTMVAWGVDNLNVPYWTIKNSWAGDWGEQGYIRVTRGTDCYGKDAVTAII